MLTSALKVVSVVTIECLHRAEPADIWKARSFIQDHLDEELSLTKVANFVKINPNHLSEKFRQVTGTNFVDYVAAKRFEEACRLLPDRRFRISEIAFEVGFQSLSQFNRVFKKRSGKSPKEYRAALPRNEDGSVHPRCGETRAAESFFLRSETSTEPDEVHARVMRYSP
jgi:AraC-like DNA-binding protein